jgi:hypothetical protein
MSALGRKRPFEAAGHGPIIRLSNCADGVTDLDGVHPIVVTIGVVDTRRVLESVALH